MKRYQRWLGLTLILLAAIGFYLLGSMRGAGLFVLVGLVFELLFWFGVFKSN